MNQYIQHALAFGAGFLLAMLVFYTPEPKTTTYIKSQVDHDRYYCHETGFLMHHWQRGDKSRWEDTMERNQFEDPVKCEVKE